MATHDSERVFSSEQKNDLAPHNNYVDALLTDLYQITMCYAYWQSKRAHEPSVFDLYFRTNPFGGEFTIFAGLEEALRYIVNFKFQAKDVRELQQRFPSWNAEFWTYLGSLDASQVKVYAIAEGTVVFPRVPLMRIEGPLAVTQLLETTLLNCINYPSLVATNAARHRLAAGHDKILLEFGLRRAQGPDGAMSASRYSYIGGFDGTSNVKAALEYGIDMKGTHAHSFVVSYNSFADLHTEFLTDANNQQVNFVEIVKKRRQELNANNTNEGELAAFVAYAQSFPRGFLALVDTYETLHSGLLNFLVVALALRDMGYQPLGIRLDSGDLAYLSKQCRKKFIEVSQRFSVPFEKLNIVASNDLNEDVLHSLKEQKHEIDTFGIGTNLVTCMAQPALGCVYKLVSLHGRPRIKISQEISKVTIPGRKECYRLYNSQNEPVIDLMVEVGQPAPLPHSRILCLHPFDNAKRAYVTPSRVESLHECVFDGKLTKPFVPIDQIRKRVIDQLSSLRSDHLRNMNPTPYKVSLTLELHTMMQKIWLQEVPIQEIV